MNSEKQRGRMWEIEWITEAGVGAEESPVYGVVMGKDIGAVNASRLNRMVRLGVKHRVYIAPTHRFSAWKWRHPLFIFFRIFFQGYICNFKRPPISLHLTAIYHLPPVFTGKRLPLVSPENSDQENEGKMLSLRSVLRQNRLVALALLPQSCFYSTLSAAAIEAERDIREGPRNDWTREEIKSIYDSPVLDLLFHGVSITSEFCWENVIENVGKIKNLLFDLFWGFYFHSK